MSSLNLSPEPTVREVLALYLTHTKTKQKPRVYQDRKSVLDLFASEHPELLLREAKPWHVQLWIERHEDRWKSDWTKKRVVGTVQTAVNWAVKLGMVDRNPFYGASHREGENGRDMTNAEFAAAMRASSLHFRRFLAAIRFTGRRPKELSEVEPRDLTLVIDPENGIYRGSWTIRNDKALTLRKSRKPLTIRLHPVAVKLFAYCIRTMHPDQQTVLINARGNPWKRYCLANRMKRLRKRLKLPRDCRLYGLRHKFGTDLVKSGIPIKTVSVLMGHTSVKTTERYTHLEGDFEHLDQALRDGLGGKKKAG